MIRCDPRAYAQCPTHDACGPCAADCEYMEGSACDLFNQHILSHTMTNGDRVRAMSDDKLARTAAKEVTARIVEMMATRRLEFSHTEKELIEYHLYHHYLRQIKQRAEVQI